MDEQRSPAQGVAQPGVIALPFRAVLTPHRSLSPRGFLILMSVLATVSFATGLLFASIGAWPVLGFFGLDVGIIYLAFRLNYRAGTALRDGRGAAADPYDQPGPSLGQIRGIRVPIVLGQGPTHPRTGRAHRPQGRIARPRRRVWRLPDR